MDRDDGLFVEFGDYKGNLNRTANGSIKEIIELGNTCILNQQALKALRTAEFKQHVVYIKPPGFVVVRKTCSTAYARSTFDENLFTDDELAEMTRSGQKIHYGHLFDDVNGDLSTAFEPPLAVARKLDTRPSLGSSDHSSPNKQTSPILDYNYSIWFLIW